MCLTLNSAAEWAGSMFQVLTVEGVVVEVLIGYISPFPEFGCAEQIVVATNYFAAGSSDSVSRPIPLSLLDLHILAGMVSIRLSPTTAWLAAIAFLVPNLVRSDDSAAAIAAGGLVSRRESRIVMAKEVLKISPTKIVVDYDFRNDSDQDVTTEVAFPIPPYKNEFPEGLIFGAILSKFSLVDRRQACPIQNGGKGGAGRQRRHGNPPDQWN